MAKNRDENRDENGRFVKGNKQRFSDTNPPKNQGSKKKLVSYVLDLLKDEGYEQVSEGQIKQIYTLLISLPQERLMVLANDKDTPMLYRIVTKEILSKKGFEVIEKMLDRAHGKATIKTEMEVSGQLDIKQLTDDELDAQIESARRALGEI